MIRQIKLPMEKVPRSEPHRGFGRRFAIGLRVTQERRKQLEAIAQQTGRSISQEIELRLERSFWDDEAMGGPEMHAAFRMMAATAVLAQSRISGPQSSKGWLNNRQLYQAVRHAWIAVIDALDPSPPRKETKSTRAQQASEIDEIGLVDIIRRGMVHFPRPTPPQKKS
jgi:hypothetical protein